MRYFLYVFLCAFGLSVFAADPFGVVFTQLDGATSRLVRVDVSIPAHHHIYADQVHLVRGDGPALRRAGGDNPVKTHDSFTDTDRDAYTQDVSLVYDVGPSATNGTVLTFSYQGCDEQECFFPQIRTHIWQAVEAVDRTPSAPAPIDVMPEHATGDWAMTVHSHHVAAHASGYLTSAEFIAFLDHAEGRVDNATGIRKTGWSRITTGLALFGDEPVRFLNAHGVWWTVLLILIGGLLLNLTPCVLPMIPINLAILGVGAQDRCRSRGFLLGAAYGSGIALVYGVLGLVVVLTGAQFGALNSLPWFNFFIGVLFIVLALAMFDVISIDFTRFQSGAMSGSGRRGGLMAAFLMGGVAALLAGACVAPVVIAVLLLSGNLYAHGAGIGLILPFVLGLGMAIPWPLAGAGLTFLPRPGKWMTGVKYGFGVFIMIFALYYFSLAYRGWRGAPVGPMSLASGHVLSVNDAAQWRDILKESASMGKPVFVDFWATWCKNCEAMEATTFRDPAVRLRLSNYLVVKLQVEKPMEPAAQAVTDYFGVKGLPTYLVLNPGKAR